MRRKPFIIIQARMGSSRLPGKVMKPLLYKPVLWHVVTRAMQADQAAGVVVATTSKLEDNVIDRFCTSNEITLFRGSETDVLDRFFRCATTLQISDVVRITADCPLHDSTIIDRVIGEYLRSRFDYVSNTIEYTYPDGVDVEVFSFEALERAWSYAELPSEREHVTPYMRSNQWFKIKNISAPKRYPAYRLSLDCIEDYQLIKAVYEAFGRDIFSLDEVIEFLEKNPELLKINQHLAV